MPPFIFTLIFIVFKIPCQKLPCEKNMLFLTCYEQKFIIFPYMKIQQMYLKYFHHTIKLAIIHLQMSHTLVLRICHANFHR